MNWISTNNQLPNFLETVWLTDGRTVWLGCREDVGDGKWLWAISNGIIYAEKGKIVSECETSDLLPDEITHWHKLPELPKHDRP